MKTYLFTVVTERGGFIVHARNGKHAMRSMAGKGHRVLSVRPRGLTPDHPYYRWERKR